MRNLTHEIINSQGYSNVRDGTGKVQFCSELGARSDSGKILKTQHYWQQCYVVTRK